MKKINENELLEKVSKLKEYIAVVESEQVNEVNLGAIGTGAMNAVRGAGGAISNALGTTAGKVAAGTALGVGGTLAAQKLAGGQALAPAGTTAKVPGKPDPKVMALQQKLIAAGAKIKADGIMGPATQAAMKQFPQVAGGAPAPAPAMTAADQEDADIGAAMQANANQAGHNAVVAGGQPDDSAGLDAAIAAQQAPATTAPDPARLQTVESVSFKNDELSRIVSLVQYR